MMKLGRLVRSVALVAGSTWGAAALAGEVICMEAESAAEVVAPMRVARKGATGADARLMEGASGGAALEVPEGVGKPPEVGGEAVLSFNVREAGAYWVWARVWWMDSCGNSLTLVMDDGAPFAFGQDGTYKSWHWVKGMKISLDPGAHRLRIQNREDGVMVDQVLLSSDADFVPVGVEEPTAAGAP